MKNSTTQKLNLYRSLKLFITVFIISIHFSNAQSYIQEGVKNIQNLSITPAAANTTTNFTLFNFITGQQVDIADSATTNWHIGFWAENTGMVTRIILNSGVSGPGSVSGIVSNGTSFENFTSTSGLVLTVDGATNATKVSQWNSGSTRLSQYNLSTTVAGKVLGSVFGVSSVTPVANRLLICKLEDGSYIKFELLSNYKNNPVSLPEIDAQAEADYGYISFRYLRSETETFTTGFSSKVSNLFAGNTHNTFFSFANSDTLALADSASTQWDIAFKGTTILLNGGTSGAGTTTGLVTVAGYNDLAQLEGSGYTADGSANKAIVSGAGNGWYNYDMTAHAITPIQGRTILIKTSYGKYVKLFITSYYRNEPSSICINASRYYTFHYAYDPYGTGNVNSTSELPVAATLPNLAAALSSSSVSSLPGVYTLTVTGNADWTLGTLPGWISASSLSGSGNSIVNLTVSGNANDTRTASLNITACTLVQSLTITQTGTNIVSAIATEFESRLAVYPNPVEDVLFLTTESDISGFSLSDIFGAVQTVTFIKTATGYQINTSSLKEGVYILIVKAGNESKRFKVIKS